MASQKGFTSLSALFAHVNNQAKQAIQDESGEVVRIVLETAKQHVQQDVYNVYQPVVYDRTGELLENWVVQAIGDGIAVYNDRRDGNTYVAEVVETGQGYQYSFEYSGVPRPFTQNTAEELIRTGKLSQALQNELIKRGFRVG